VRRSGKREKGESVLGGEGSRVGHVQAELDSRAEIDGEAAHIRAGMELVLNERARNSEPARSRRGGGRTRYSIWGKH